LSIVVNFDTAKLKLLVDNCCSETIHFHQLSLALVFIIHSGKVAPVAPGKGNLGRRRVDLKDFPWKGGKGSVELVM
jgi:hypothetical protein